MSRGGATAISACTPTAICCVHPERDPARAIDLKELAERLEMRGLSLPILVRFSGILKDRITRDPPRVCQRHQGIRLQGRLLVRLSDQGEPAAAGGRGDRPLRHAVRLWSGSGQQAGAAGGRRHDRRRRADHLQRVQGQRIPRDGHAGPEDGPARSSRCWRNSPTWNWCCTTPSGWVCGRASAFGPSWRPAVPDAGRPPAAIDPSSD